MPFLNTKQESHYKDAKIFHFCSMKQDKQANALFLMGAFMIVALKQSAEVTWEQFQPYHRTVAAFRDASYGECTYQCTVNCSFLSLQIFHCLKGLELAIKHGWYKFKEFDPREYEYYEKVENGDLNWIIPGKFLAFMGPVDNKRESKGNYPEDYL